MNGQAEVLLCCRRGWTHLNENHPEEATKDFQKAVEIADDLLEAHEGLGLSLFQQIDNFERMMDRMGRPGSFSSEDIANAKPTARTVNIDGVPIDGKAFLKIVEMAGIALVELMRAFTMGTVRVDVYEALARTPQVDSSVRRECLDRALKQNPESAWANFCRGMDHVHSKNYSAATEFLFRACSVNPDDAEWQTDLGNALLNLGNIIEAIGHLALAARLNPGFASAWYNLGTAYLQIDKRDIAMMAYRKFFAIEPYSTDAQQLKQMFPELSSPPINLV